MCEEVLSTYSRPAGRPAGQRLTALKNIDFVTGKFGEPGSKFADDNTPKKCRFGDIFFGDDEKKMSANRHFLGALSSANRTPKKCPQTGHSQRRYHPLILPFWISRDLVFLKGQPKFSGFENWKILAALSEDEGSRR